MDACRRVNRVLGVAAMATALLAASTAVHADGLTDLHAGIHAYDQGDPEKAATLLRTAVRTLANERDRALGWVYLGLCAFSRKDEPAARGAFREALGADPEVAPPRERIPPPALALYDGLRASLSGELLIEATEAGAQIFVGERVRGAAPLRLRLPIGRHAIRVLSQDRHRQFEDRGLIVRPAGNATVVARLAPRLGRLAFDILPMGAEVREGRRLVAKMPSPAVPLAAGRVRLRLSAPGFEPLERELEVAPDATTSLQARLAPARGEPPWWSRRRPWGWISLGAGAAFVAGGLASGALAQSSIDEIQRGLQARTLSMGGYDALAAEARSRSTRANVLLGVGGVAAALGLVLVLWGDERAPAASLIASPAGLAIGGAF